MTIDWVAFLIVLVTSLVVAVVAVALFATGVRLLATPARGVPAAPGGDPEEGETVPRSQRPPAATALAVLAFVLAGAVALTGVVLIIH